MNAVTLYLVGIASVVGLALGSMLFLRSPLRALLVELCGNERRASFWLVFWILGVVFTTSFGVLSAMPEPAAPLWREAPALRVFLETLRAGLFGLLGILSILAFLLLVAIRGYEDRARRERAWPQPPLAAEPRS